MNDKMKIILLLIANMFYLGHCGFYRLGLIHSPRISNAPPEPSVDAGQQSIIQTALGVGYHILGQSVSGGNQYSAGLDLNGNITKFVEGEPLKQDILINDRIVEEMREKKDYINDTPNEVTKHIGYSKKYKARSEMTFSNSSQSLLEACTRVTIGASVKIGWFWSVSGSVEVTTTNKETTVVNSHRTQKVTEEEEIDFEDKSSFTLRPFQKIRVESYVEVVKGERAPYKATVIVTGTKANGQKGNAQEIKDAMRRRNTNGTVVAEDTDWVRYQINAFIVRSYGRNVKNKFIDMSDPTTTTPISSTPTEWTGTTTTEAMLEKPDTRIEPTPIGLGSLATLQWIVITIIVCFALYFITKLILKYKIRNRDEINSYDISMPVRKGLDY